MYTLLSKNSIHLHYKLKLLISFIIQLRGRYSVFYQAWAIENTKDISANWDLILETRSCGFIGPWINLLSHHEMIPSSKELFRVQRSKKTSSKCCLDPLDKLLAKSSLAWIYLTVKSLKLFFCKLYKLSNSIMQYTSTIVNWLLLSQKKLHPVL